MMSVIMASTRSITRTHFCHIGFQRDADIVAEKFSYVSTQ